MDLSFINSYEQDQPDLPASVANPSLGLADLPPMGDMAGPTAVAPAADAPASFMQGAGAIPDASPAGGMDSAPVTAPVSGDSLDESPYVRERRALVEGMNPLQKIGYLLQSVQAGIDGKANPIDVMMENKRKHDEESRKNLVSTLDDVNKGLDMIQNQPQMKNAIVAAIAKANPQAAAMLESVDENDVGIAKKVAGMVSNPAGQQMLLKAVSALPVSKQGMEARRLLSDDSFAKQLERTVDNNVIAGIYPKMETLRLAIGRNPSIVPDSMKDSKGNLNVTYGQLTELNQQLPQELQFTPEQMETLSHEGPQLRMVHHGLIPDLKTKEDLKNQSRDENRSAADKPNSAVAKLNDDIKNNRITQEQYDQAIKRLDVPVQKMADASAKSAAADAAWNPEAIKEASARYKLDGTLPAGRLSEVVRGKILAGAAEMNRAEGNTAEYARIAQLANKANSGALLQLTKQEQMVGAFEKNAIRNADVALANSDKVDRTGVPVLNRWILAGQKEIAGDPGVAKFHQANETFVNEYAKIMSGSMGNTAVSDSLRRETQSMLATKDTPEQYRAVVEQMKLEMRNRMKGFEDQKSELRSSMSGGRRESDIAPKPAGGIPRVSDATSYNAVPSGSQYYDPSGTLRRKP